MAHSQRNAVFVALSGTIGHDLIFRHYTNKVVAAKFPERKGQSGSRLQKKQAKKTK